MKENQFLALTSHDMKIQNNFILKGTKLFLDFSGEKLYYRVLPPAEKDRKICFRLTNKSTNLKIHAQKDSYKIVIPEGARFKQALWEIAQPEKERKISAIAGLKELYFRNKARLKIFVPDPELSDAMHAFTMFCNTENEQHASVACDIFLKLNKKYKGDCLA